MVPGVRGLGPGARDRGQGRGLVPGVRGIRKTQLLCRRDNHPKTENWPEVTGNPSKWAEIDAEFIKITWESESEVGLV